MVTLMTIQDLHAALTAPVDRLGALLRSQEVIGYLNAADDALKKMPALDDALARVAVLEERLKKAGEREAALRQEMADQVAKLKADHAADCKRGEEHYEQHLNRMEEAGLDLRKRLKAAEAENESLRRRVEEMESHPDVKKAKREQLAAQLAEIQRQHAALADPEPDVTTGSVATSQLADNSITESRLANAKTRILGRGDTTHGDPVELTAAEITEK